jgi:hypothetical protein
MVPIPFIMTACCLKDPTVYFSTGTIVGLEATSPTNETPPSMTFGYKRAEIAMVPVTKLDEKSASSPSDRGCSELPPSAYSGSSIAKDAYSVLAAFHLAVNWFGPAKIEQHFATGCAATHLIRGLTEEEEDKRKAEEAGNEYQEAKRLVRTTKDGAERLLHHAQALEKAIQKTKDDAEKASSTIDNNTSDGAKKDAQTTLLQAEKDVSARQTTAKRLQFDADNINRLEEATTMAQSAIEKAYKATRTEEVRPKAQKTKENATQLLTNATAMKQQVSDDISKAGIALNSVLKLGDEIKAKVSAKTAP